MNTKRLLLKVLDELREDSIVNPPKSIVHKIPTLEKYKSITPMLQERFSDIGSWIDSTHGDWLDVDEMECFWDKDSKDSRVKNIISNIVSSINNWEDDAGSVSAKIESVFLQEAKIRMSVFI